METTRDKYADVCDKQAVSMAARLFITSHPPGREDGRQDNRLRHKRRNTHTHTHTNNRNVSCMKVM